MASSRTRYGIIGAIAVVAVIAAAGVYWFVASDAPDEVDLDTAASGVRERTTTPTPTSTGHGTAHPSAPAPGALEGTWTVDPDTGEFDYESATGSFVGFRVQEELAGIGAATAVGRTGSLNGSMTIEGTTVPEASFEVDMTSITTNDSRRDRRVQSALETDQHPTARFTLTQPIELGEAAASGGPVTVDAVGELTVHGVTKPFTIPLEAQLVDDTVVVVGSAQITFSAFGVAVPEAPIVVSAEDHGILELQLLFTRG